MKPEIIGLILVVTFCLMLSAGILLFAHAYNDYLEKAGGYITIPRSSQVPVGMKGYVQVPHLSQWLTLWYNQENL